MKKYIFISVLFMINLVLNAYVNEVANNFKYHLDLGRRGLSLIIGTQDKNGLNYKRIGTIRAPQGYEFTEVGAGDPNNKVLFVITSSVEGIPIPSESALNIIFLKDMKLKQLLIFSNIKPSYLVVFSQGRILFNYFDKKVNKAITKLYEMNFEGKEVILKLITEEEGLLGIENNYMFYNKIDRQKNLLFFHKKENTEMSIISLNHLTGSKNVVAKVLLDGANYIYLINVREKSLLLVKHFDNEIIFEVYEKNSQKLLFKSGRFIKNSLNQSFLLDENGEKLYRLIKKTKEQECELVSINLKNNKELIIKLNETVKNYLKKNKYIKLKTNKDGRVIFGKYIILKDGKIIEKNCLGCSK